MHLQNYSDCSRKLNVVKYDNLIDFMFSLNSPQVFYGTDRRKLMQPRPQVTYLPLTGRQVSVDIEYFLSFIYLNSCIGVPIFVYTLLTYWALYVQNFSTKNGLIHMLI